MGRKLTLDANGRVVYQTEFPSQVNNIKNINQGIARLKHIKSGGRPLVCVDRKHLGGIGDILMMTPTIKALHKEIGADVVVSVNPEYLNGALVQALSFNPYIKNIIDYKDMKPNDFDTVIDLACPCGQYEERKSPPYHRVDIFAKHAGLGDLKDKSLDYFVQEDERVKIKQWLSAQNIKGKQLLVVQPHSSTKRRDYNSVWLQQVLMSLKKTHYKTLEIVVILHNAYSLQESWKLDGIHLFQDFNTRMIGALLDAADMVLCMDSSVLHQAGALNKKILTLFGPIPPQARIAYFDNCVALNAGTTLSCYACFFSNCTNNFACWSRLKPDFIIDIANKMLNNEPVPNNHPHIILPKSKQISNSKFEIL